MLSVSARDGSPEGRTLFRYLQIIQFNVHSGRADLDHRPPGPEPESGKSLSHRPRVTYGI